MQAQLCLMLQPHGLQPTRLLCPWDFPGKNTGVGCHSKRLYSNKKFKTTEKQKDNKKKEKRNVLHSTNVSLNKQISLQPTS